MRIENILSKAKLAFPDDIVLLEPDVIAKKLQENAGIQKGELHETMSKLFECAMTSEGLPDTIPRGLTEGTIDCFKILSAARFANSIGGAPSITVIAKVSNISRNLVSPCVKFLEGIDLVITKPHLRGQLVIPTHLTTMYIDVISGNLGKEYDRLKTVADEAKRGEVSNESLDFLEYLETVFHIAKLAYDEATVNYEIMEDLHNRVRALVVKAKEGRKEETMKDLDEFLDILKHIISVRAKAKKMGVHPVTLEETDEKLGRARVFRVK